VIHHSVGWDPWTKEVLDSPTGLRSDRAAPVRSSAQALRTVHGRSRAGNGRMPTRRSWRRRGSSQLLQSAYANGQISVIGLLKAGGRPMVACKLHGIGDPQ
jgi:hypothetical protein